MQTKNTMTFV